jgi:hypothetical protein
MENRRVPSGMKTMSETLTVNFKANCPEKRIER